MNCILLFSCFVFRICSFSFFPKRFFQGLSPQDRIGVEAVSDDLGANRLGWQFYCRGYLTLMTWALEQNDSKYIDRLVKGAHPDLISSALQVYIQDGQHQRLVSLLPRIVLAPETWLKLLRAAANAAGTKETSNHITILNILLSQDCTWTNSIISSRDEIFSQALSSSKSEFLLEYLMHSPIFTVHFSRQISAGWFDVIRCAIGQNKFSFLRKMLADWEGLKRAIDLATVENIHIPGVRIPAECRKQFFIVQAIEANYNLDVLWLLAGRTTLFRTFKDVNFRNSHYGQELIRIIPEVDLIQWDSRSTSEILSEFINQVYLNHPDNIAAQSTVLLSSTWKMPLEEYLKGALQACSFTKIRATVQAGKLKLAHLTLIHMSPCTALDIEDLDRRNELVKLDKEIDGYLGAFDPLHLCYRNEGPILLYIHVMLAQVDWRSQHQLVKLISGWFKVGNMAVLRSLDKIIESIESDILLIGGFPTEIAQMARVDPSSILDIRVAWNLLTYYAANEHLEMLADTIDRLPLITKCNCALVCTNSPVIMGPLEFSIKGDPRLYKFLHTEANLRGRTLIPKYVLTLIDEDKLHKILVASAEEAQPNLLRIAVGQLGENLSELIWIRALCGATAVAFNLLFGLPRATRLDWVGHHSDLIDKHVLVPALKNDNQEIAGQILHHKQFHVMTQLQQDAIIFLAAERKLATLNWFFDMIEWENIVLLHFSDNEMLDALLEGGKSRRRLVGRMMRNRFVFQFALTKPLNNQWILFEMFPQLLGVTDVDQAYRTF